MEDVKNKFFQFDAIGLLWIHYKTTAVDKGNLLLRHMMLQLLTAKK